MKELFNYKYDDLFNPTLKALQKFGSSTTIINGITFLIFITNSLIAQNSNLLNLDKDFGFVPVKLESKFEVINSLVKLYAFKCYDCQKRDSISQERQINETKKIIIGGVPMNGQSWMYFIDNNLYRMQLSFYNHGNESQSVLNYLLSQYGKEIILSGKSRIWESSKVYLSATFPEYNSYDNNICNITVYSKRLDSIYKVRINALENKSQKSEEREGRGNGTFIPDVNFSIKLLLANSTITNFEKLLPSFSVSKPDTLYDYNKITEKYDVFNSIRYTYTFTYKNQIPLSAEVRVSKNKVIKAIEYHFDSDPFIRFTLQRNQNGLIINEGMTKIVAKMGLNDCIVYDNNQKIHLTEYTSQHFKVAKY